jgi:hypothetical protein
VNEERERMSWVRKRRSYREECEREEKLRVVVVTGS